ncbi:hypothetical protein ZEAMMB73_Zm00001d052347 [Zea mays]|uniref:Uncharacterized protein n=1 Tax=Zea mays TaxID=4577 RepID=A0A1D6QGJ7_MAIZE|nr:hypothetical protein ZEAMMB73_Zm00001d052347 [Zea mays]
MTEGPTIQSDKALVALAVAAARHEQRRQRRGSSKWRLQRRSDDKRHERVLVSNKLGAGNPHAAHLSIYVSAVFSSFFRILQLLLENGIRVNELTRTEVALVVP